MLISVCVSLLNLLTDTDLYQYHHYHSPYLPLGEQVPHKGLTKKGNGKWQVQIWHEGQSRYVGVYNNIAIASSAYHFAMNFVSIKLVTKLEQFSQEDVRADISALKAFVNESLKTLSANTNKCSHHQDKSRGCGGLPVRVGRTNTVSSLGLVLSADTQLSCFKICSVCARTLPHSDFSRKQHHSSLRKCKSCIRQIDNSGTRGQVLLRNHRMSNGLVNGMLHEVPGKKTQDRAIRCIKDDRTVS